MNRDEVYPSLCEMRNFSPGQVWAGAFVGGRQAPARSPRVHPNRNIINSQYEDPRGRVSLIVIAIAVVMPGSETHDLERRQPLAILAVTGRKQ